MAGARLVERRGAWVSGSFVGSVGVNVAGGNSTEIEQLARLIVDRISFFNC